MLGLVREHIFRLAFQYMIPPFGTHTSDHNIGLSQLISTFNNDSMTGTCLNDARFLDILLTIPFGGWWKQKWKWPQYPNWGKEARTG